MGPCLGRQAVAAMDARSSRRSRNKLGDVALDTATGGGRVGAITPVSGEARSSASRSAFPITFPAEQQGPEAHQPIMSSLRARPNSAGPGTSSKWAKFIAECTAAKAVPPLFGLCGHKVFSMCLLNAAISGLVGSRTPAKAENGVLRGELLVLIAHTDSPGAAPRTPLMLKRADARSIICFCRRSGSSSPQGYSGLYADC